MKKLIIILFLILSLPGFATKYYVKNDGNNTNTGLSDAQAWQTIAKVNSSSFSPGDTIAFKRGHAWREMLTIPSSGNASNYLVFTNYDTGSNPIIYGSSVSSGWTNQGSNVWSSNSTFASNPNTYSNIWFCTESDTTWGIYKSTTGAVTAPYNWAYSSSRVYVYSTSDPGTAFSNIECAQRLFCIDLGDESYIEINGIDLHMATWGGVLQHTDNAEYTGLTIRNCYVSYMGGINGYGYGTYCCYNNTLIEDCSFHDMGRRGVSINNYSNYDIENIVIQQCTFWNGYHTTGPDIETGTSTSGDMDSVIVRNCLIYDDPDRDLAANVVSLFLQGPHGGSGQLRGVYIYNNIIKYGFGHGLSVEDVDGVYVYNNTFYEYNWNTYPCYLAYFDDGSTDIDVKNNIFYTLSTTETQGSGAGLATYAVSDAQVDADYNLYYRVNNSVRIMLISGSSYYMNTAFPINKGYETNGLKGDPLFVSSSNLAVQEGSPAIENALAVDYITTDYYGNARGASPTIGAIEYDASPPVLVTSITISAAGSATTIETDGGTLQMYTNVEPDNASDTTKTWSVIDGTGSATIAQTGIVTAATDGIVTVRATANDASGVYDEYELTISNQDVPEPAPEPIQYGTIMHNGRIVKHNGFKVVK
ncbi:MAG: Ig-like domain-containing protein [Clostridia bacterium]